MEEPLTYKDLKAFLATHKAIKKYVFAKECKLSRFQFMRLEKGQGYFDKHSTNIEKVMIKYGYKPNQ